LLAGAGKKMHLFHNMYHQDGRLLATCEQMLIHVSLETRRASPPSQAIAAKLAQIAALHAQLPLPDGAGRFIGQGR
jgi:carnitine 3-dehydrogenase / betainyl-CoA thioesterase